MTAVDLAQDILPPAAPIAVYDEFRSQLAEMRQANSQTLFDYESPKGNKEARSHIYKLRQTKAAVDKARAAEKAASLEYGRKVDAEAKEIIAEIEAMIQVHQRPLDEIEQREKDRVAGIQAKVAAIRDLYQIEPTFSSAAIEARIATLKSTVIDDSFGEFQLEAMQQKDSGLQSLEAALPIAQKREAEQAELERLRQEAAERERRDREDRIRQEAAARAAAEAEAKAKAEREAIERKAAQERQDAERRELELRLAAERSEKERIAAEQRERDAVENERRRALAEAQAQAAEDARREADKKHTAQIHSEIAAGMSGFGIEAPLASEIVTAIRDGLIPHLKITY